jgi:phenylacetic acid degradation protein paaN
MDSSTLFGKHEKQLNDALAAIRRRTYWSAYPEVPSGKIYGETAKDEGLAAFEARRNKYFDLGQPGSTGRIGAEVSPFGPALGITYPQADLDQLIPAVRRAADAWRKVDSRQRAGICLEILQRLNRRSFEMASAVMHTTGQSFVMSFQAGGPHAQDRGLEAVAYAFDELSRCPAKATWEKQTGKTEVTRLEKTYHIVPRGIAVTIGCSTFPTWNSYPGFFASLVTGNAVIVKPHPGAVLPLALTVETAREVLREQDLDPNVVTLAADSAAAPLTRQLVMRPEVGIIDYTGGSEFGRWIEEHARHAVVFTEKAGVNCAILDSAADLGAVAANLAFSISLYSGQMCTAPHNIFIPAAGMATPGGRVGFEDVAGALIKAIDALLSDPQRAADVLGAIQNEKTLQRIEEFARAPGKVLRASTAVHSDKFPQARTRTPLVLGLEARQKDVFMREAFGPIALLIRTRDTSESVALAAEAARCCGAITSAVYSTDHAVLDSARDALTLAGAAVSCNLTGQIFVNQAAAFSDFHVSGLNPAGSATLCDAAFVASRFRVVQSRIPLTAS